MRKLLLPLLLLGAFVLSAAPAKAVHPGIAGLGLSRLLGASHVGHVRHVHNGNAFRFRNRNFNSGYGYGGNFNSFSVGYNSFGASYASLGASYNAAVVDAPSEIELELLRQAQEARAVRLAAFRSQAFYGATAGTCPTGALAFSAGYGSRFGAGVYRGGVRCTTHGTHQ